MADIVLDTNIWISLFWARRATELTQQVENYSLLLHADSALRGELALVLSRPKIQARLGIDHTFYLDFFDAMTIMHEGIEPKNWDSPDPKDDFLFDLCTATNASLVTGDKRLLAFQDSPVEVISWQDFREQFPV